MRYLHVISLLHVSTSDAIAREKTQLLGINYFDEKGEMQREKKRLRERRREEEFKKTVYTHYVLNRYIFLQKYGSMVYGYVAQNGVGDGIL